MIAYHTFPPVFNDKSEILILGSFPSVKSREEGFFYGHPQNRFWKVTAAVFQSPVPDGIAAKKAFLLQHRIALWDVIASCEIKGSSDSSIKNVVPNDIGRILCQAAIREIYVNGKTAEKLYHQYIRNTVGRPAVYLPSTSPANAAWSLERLIAAWRLIANQKIQNIPTV